MAEYAGTKRDRPILYYDGECQLCHFWVQFLIRIDRKHRCRLVSLQAADGQTFMLQHGLDPGCLDSVLFWDGSQVSERSDAIISLLTFMPLPWRWFRAIKWFPKAWRDRLYAWVAANRYSWFGKRHQCQLPHDSRN